MDECTQSSIGYCLSQISWNSQVEIDDSRSIDDQRSASFKKNVWFRGYFRYERSSSGTIAIFNACETEFKNRSNTGMTMHLNKCKCKSTDFNPNIQEIHRNMETTSSITTGLLAQALVEAGWSLRGIETDGFKRFVARLSPNWKTPARQEIAGLPIPRCGISKMSRLKFHKTSNQMIVLFLQYYSRCK